VAKTIVRAIRAAHPKARYPTGAAARTVLMLKGILPDRLFDRLVWRVSQSFAP
jgi:hypothetical protein